MNTEPKPAPHELTKEIPDNARKFTLTDRPDFLSEHDATGFLLVTDWLDMSKDAETKIVRKEFGDGRVQLLLIAKETDANGNRKAKKAEISEAEYLDLLPATKCNVTKQRYEFTFAQDLREFSLKYDVFQDSTLRVLEVDAPDEAQRSLFDPTQFPSELAEVSDGPTYSGYRVAEHV